MRPGIVAGDEWNTVSFGKVTEMNVYLSGAWPLVAQVAEVRRTVTKKGETSIEVVSLITALSPRASAASTLALPPARPLGHRKSLPLRALCLLPRRSLPSSDRQRSAHAGRLSPSRHFPAPSRLSPPRFRRPVAPWLIILNRLLPCFAPKEASNHSQTLYSIIRGLAFPNYTLYNERKISLRSVTRHVQSADGRQP